jgi:predicted TPR repeat methyltransferase
MSQLAKAYALKEVADTRTLYDEWAATYDTEMADQTQDYVGPTLAAVYTLKCLGPEKIANAKILDAGCGTGLVGVQLAKVGAKHIDGVDLSEGMLDIARKANVYEDLKPTDLTAPLVYKNGTYDAIVCIGTFTQGHVGPDAFSEFVRVTSKGGFIVATVLASIWENGGYEAKVAGLAEEGKVKLLSSELEDYRRGAGVQARMIVLQVL